MQPKKLLFALLIIGCFFLISGGKADAATSECEVMHGDFLTGSFDPSGANIELNFTASGDFSNPLMRCKNFTGIWNISTSTISYVNDFDIIGTAFTIYDFDNNVLFLGSSGGKSLQAILGSTLDDSTCISNDDPNPCYMYAVVKDSDNQIISVSPIFADRGKGLYIPNTNTDTIAGMTEINWTQPIIIAGFWTAMTAMWFIIWLFKKRI